MAKWRGAMELFDIYDDERNRTGRTAERNQKLKGSEHQLIVHVNIMNTQNQLLIQQSQPHKPDWPGYWDISVGGGVQSGETSREAAEREVFEELGLEIDLAQAVPYFWIHFPNGFADEYIVHQDLNLGKLNLQPTEVQGVKWASYDEVMCMMKEGTFFPYQRSMLELIFSFSEIGDKT
ncbi:NUDIX hydrolase [Lactococcus laudensis]|uniref:NUDIX hydrolase n=2 Tax=Pseudolactococcus laudensis TaxID=1494461 RepID=UPI0012DE9EC2